VWVANHNTADETVIAGSPEAVARASAQVLDLGARRVTPIEVGGAFHTPLMAPASHRLRKALATTTLHPAEIPVVANVDGRVHQAPEDWPLLLAAQLVSPVRWRQSIRHLGGLTGRGGASVRLLVEIGPGGSLAGMIRRILPGMTTVSVSTPDDLDVLVDAIAGNTPLHAFAAGHQGEQLYVSERLVISPGPGVFQPAAGLDQSNGAEVEVGTLLGAVGVEEVRSPFAGALMGMLAHPGERVQSGQPIAWLRAG
ncbi:MAG: acyltransferase domain-containing protein, partial [Acidimicrobiales bacterium]